MAIIDEVRRGATGPRPSWWSSRTGDAAIAAAVASARPGDVVISPARATRPVQQIGERSIAVRRPRRGPRGAVRLQARDDRTRDLPPVLGRRVAPGAGSGTPAAASAGSSAAASASRSARTARATSPRPARRPWAASHRRRGRRRLPPRPRRHVPVPFTRSAWLVMLAIVGAAARRAWPTTGSRCAAGAAWAEQAGQVRRAQICGRSRLRPAACYWGGVSHHPVVHPLRLAGLDLGAVAWVVWATVIIARRGQRVNLTDGLDGLAAGSSAFCFACLAVDRRSGSSATPTIYHVHARPRPGSRRRALAGACARLPVVERRAGADLHGRHRLARHRRRPGLPVPAR